MANLSEVSGHIYLNNFESEARKEQVIEKLEECFDSFEVKGEKFNATCSWSIQEEIDEFDYEEILKDEEEIELNYYEAEEGSGLYQEGIIVIHKNGITKDIIEDFTRGEAFNSGKFNFYNHIFKNTIEQCFSDYLESLLEDETTSSPMVEAIMTDDITSVLINGEVKYFNTGEILEALDDESKAREILKQFSERSEYE